VPAQHQSLLHFVGQGGWLDDRVLAKVRDLVLPAMERNRAIEAWIIDDTGFRRRGSSRSASHANIADNSANRQLPGKAWRDGGSRAIRAPRSSDRYRRMCEDVAGRFCPVA